MKTVYQVQFRLNKNLNWITYNIKGNSYDVTESIEVAKAVLEKAKQHHKHLSNTYDSFKTDVYEYRIAKITFDVEYI